MSCRLSAKGGRKAYGRIFRCPSKREAEQTSIGESKRRRLATAARTPTCRPALGIPIHGTKRLSALVDVIVPGFCSGWPHSCLTQQFGLLLNLDPSLENAVPHENPNSRLEGCVVRQLDRNRIEVPVEAAIGFHRENAASRRILQPFDVNIIEHEVSCSYISPDVDRVIVPPH